MSRYVSVEVDLADFEDEDIEDEYELRGLGKGGVCIDDIQEMYYAFKLGKTERAIELARQIAQNATGRILP